MRVSGSGVTARILFAATAVNLLLAGCKTFWPWDWFSGATTALPPLPPPVAGPAGSWMLIAGGIACVIFGAVIFWLFKDAIGTGCFVLSGILLVALDFVGTKQTWLVDVVVCAVILGFGYLLVRWGMAAKALPVQAQAVKELVTGVQAVKDKAIPKELRAAANDVLADVQSSATQALVASAKKALGF